jgi:Na+-transporting methylmalonyl-CoA/oxaloacetate decarboxylase gamma subunit
MKKFAVLTVLFVAITMFMGKASASPVNIAVPTDAVALIVQAESVETAVAAVEAVGGQVNEKLGIINAVSATVSQDDVATLEADERVVRVTIDRAAEVAGGSLQLHSSLKQ